MIRKSLPVFFALLAAVFFAGCTVPDSSVIRLNEKQIAEQEMIAEQARQQFRMGRFEEAAALLEPLCLQRTTNQPLYQCELGFCYLACNNKQKAKEYLLDAYTSIEGFFDPASEKKAVSLWGSEAEKVFKGEPYEQATLGLFAGMLLLEEGDVDNAMACFKNGEIADSDVAEERFKSDYGLLQLMEAKCCQMRGEPDVYNQFITNAIRSFAMTHPYVITAESAESAQISSESLSEIEKTEMLRERILEAETRVYREYEPYYKPLLNPYNTLVLVWTGCCPKIERSGQYGEQRVFIKNPPLEIHYEIQVNGSQWHDLIRGYADVTFQATTRGGRQMDNVLADQAAFKHTTEEVGNTMFDLANNTSDAYAKLTFLVAGLIASGISQSANVKADIRSIKALPGQMGVLPLQLPAGTHTVRIDCYDRNFRLNRSMTHQLQVEAKPFQFFNIVIPPKLPPPPEQETKADLAQL